MLFLISFFSSLTSKKKEEEKKSLKLINEIYNVSFLFKFDRPKTFSCPIAFATRSAHHKRITADRWFSSDISKNQYEGREEKMKKN